MSTTTTRRANRTPEPPAAADLVAAARAFFLDADAAGAVAVAGREHLARVETPSGPWKVRRWPRATPEGRIAFVHAALARARVAGIAIAPAVARLPGAAGRTILLLDGRRYDAQAWLPGQSALPPPAYPMPDITDHLPASLPEATVAEVARAVSRLHGATLGLAQEPGAPAAPLAGLVPTVRRAWLAQRDRLRPAAPRTPEIQRWLAITERALPAAEAALETNPLVESPSSAVLHRALWPAHLLLPESAPGEAPPEGEVVGLIGWEGVAAGSPLLDLAQLVVRCRGWSAGAAEGVIAAYGEIRPLPPEERRLLPVIAALDLVVSAGAILDAGFGPDADGAPPSRLRVAATFLVNSLEVAAAVVAQGEQPVKHGRRWEYGPRPTPPPSRPGGGARRPTRPARPPRGGPSGPKAPRQPRRGSGR